MRLRRRAVREEPPEEQAGVEEIDLLFPPVELHSPRPDFVQPMPPGLESQAQRAAARRRLDRLADEF